MSVAQARRERRDRLGLVARGREVGAQPEGDLATHRRTMISAGRAGTTRCSRRPHMVHDIDAPIGAQREETFMHQRIVRFTLLVGLAFGVTAGIARAEEATMSFTVVNIEYEGSKVWTPGTLVVKKDTLVKLKLVNKVPSDPNQHGFAIPAYNIAEVVTRGEDKSIEFKADKPGVFPIICQLHPAHVGGELVVLP
jgi:nitrosocyanin